MAGMGGAAYECDRWEEPCLAFAQCRSMWVRRGSVFFPFPLLFFSPLLIPFPPVLFHSLASSCATPPFSHDPPRHLVALFLFLSSHAALLSLLHLLDRRLAEPKAGLAQGFCPASFCVF